MLPKVKTKLRDKLSKGSHTHTPHSIYPILPSTRLETTSWFSGLSVHLSFVQVSLHGYVLFPPLSSIQGSKLNTFLCTWLFPCNGIFWKSLNTIWFLFFFLKEPKFWFISLILCFFDLYLIISAFIFIIIFLFWGGWLCDSFPNLLSWELNFFVFFVPTGLANLIHPFTVRLLEWLCIFHIKHRVRDCFMSQCEKFVLLLGDLNPLTFCDMTDVWFQH